MDDPTDSTTPSGSRSNPQSKEPLVNRAAPALRGFHNASQPSTILAKPPTSSFTFRVPTIPTSSSSDENDQIAALQQPLSNLTLGVTGNPGSSSTVEASINGAYNIDDEPAPSEPFYSQTFQLALKSGIRIASDASDGLTTLRGSMTNQGLRSLQENADTLKNYQCSGTRTIAVLGDSGQGE
jgi:hypothetical protein